MSLTDLQMLLTVTLEFGGASAAVVIGLLLLARSKVSVETWKSLLRLAGWWCGIAAAAFALLGFVFAESAGWHRLGIIFIYYPAWLVLLFPAFPAFVLLKLKQPIAPT